MPVRLSDNAGPRWIEAGLVPAEMPTVSRVPQAPCELGDAS